MPKILILFADEHIAMVNAVADGARAVRFSEVETRRAGAPALPGGVEDLALFDAIVLGVSARGAIHPEIQRVIEQAAKALPTVSWQNKVGSAFVAAPDAGDQVVDLWPALATLGGMGMLVVSPAGAQAEAARALGTRVAQVVGWVTHARSHHHAH